tara:strand:- start:403 stop:1473 length:1071 start_codon:yes stop_codon:yes gene_type:complete
MYNKNKNLYKKYKNDNFSPNFGYFFNDNSSVNSVISYEDFNQNVIEIQPLNTPDIIEAQNINLYEPHNDIEDNIDSQSNISSISDDSFDSNLMDFYQNPKKCYISYIFCLLNWILYFTIQNNEQLIFYSTTLYPQCKDIRSEIWRLITNAFVHSNLNHILSNTLILFPFMMINEFMINKKHLLFIIFISIINTNLFFYYLNPYKALLGASGIVFCLAGISLSNLILNFNSLIKYHKISLFLLNLFIFFIEFISYFNSNSESTAYCCHWFSYLSGLILSNSILPVKNLNNNKIYFRSINIVLYFLGNIFLIVNYLDWPKYYSYNELFQKQDINNCCHQLFSFLKTNEYYTKNDFTCI